MSALRSKSEVCVMSIWIADDNGHSFHESINFNHIIITSERLSGLL